MDKNENDKLPVWWKTKANWYAIAFVILFLGGAGLKACDGELGSAKRAIFSSI